MALTTLLLFTLAGCDRGGSWLDRESLSCSADAYDWFGGLSLYLDQGELSDGIVDFEYAAPQDYIAKISGSYDAVGGDYDYSVVYSGYYLETDAVSGYGSVYHNGSVDLLHTVVRTDILGSTSSFQVREERYGCDGKARRYSLPQGQGDAPALLDTTWYTIASADQVDYSLEEADGSGGVTGSWWSDLSATYVEDYGADWYAEGSSYASGERYKSFTSEDDIYRYTGTVDYSPDGGQIWDYEARYQTGEQQVVFSVYKDISYSGTGTAVWTYADRTCEVTYGADGSCSYTCTDGEVGRC